MKGNKGTALITVLWVVLVLSLVTFSLASSVRVEATSTLQSFDSGRAFYMARGAAELVFNSYSKDLPFPANSPVKAENGEYVVPFDSGEARVRFHTDGERININAASDLVLATIFNSLRLDRETRNSLVDSILDWRDADDIPHLYGAEIADYPENSASSRTRPGNDQFRELDELLLVKNMTPEIFYGQFFVDSVTGQYVRVPGLRDLVALTGSGVNPNIASFDVLAALPGITPALAAEVISERTEKPFANGAELEQRIFGFSQNEVFQYLQFERGPPTELVSRATVSGTGVSRSVRLLFKTVEKVTFIGGDTNTYRIGPVTLPDRWRYE